MRLGIDPGKSGGAALLEEDGSFYAVEPFRSEEQMNAVLDSWPLDRVVRAALEKVHSFSGQGVVSAFSFGMNYGWWRGQLDSRGLSSKTRHVEPRAWQKAIGVQLPGHVQKTAHKNALKDVAQQMFPGVRVTLATADALLIARFGV